MWVCQFIAILGMSMVVPFLPFYIRELGVTNPVEVTQWSGLVFAAPFMIVPFSSPLWAMIGDRHGRKIMVVRASFGLALAQIFIATATSPTQLFFGRLIQGSFGGFIGAALALVSTRTPKEHLGYALGVLQTASAAGTLAGPFFGGLIADFIDHRTAFLVVSLLCVVSGAVVIWKVDEHPSSMRGKEPKMNILERYRFLWQSRELRWCLLIALVANAASTAVVPLFALYVEKMLPAARFISTKTGLIFSAGALSVILASHFWGARSDRHLYRSNIFLGSCLAAVMLFAQGLVTNAWQLLPLFAVQSAFSCGISTTLFSLISRRTEERIRGGVLAVLNSTGLLGVLVGPMTGSLIAAHLGIPSAFFFGAALLLVVTLMSAQLTDSAEKT